ncbi:MAG: tetratricopeptide repeat protein, partial [Brevundimonas sp.]
MKDKADNSASTPRRSAGAGDIVSFGLIVGAVVLGWQIALQPLMQRAPVEAAIRIAPTSPLVLRRAAEAELGADRNDNAAVLGREAFARSPFDVRALRVVGLTEARAGREDQADDILTLAGNWSLRDDPTHAWLVERRLRQGDYSSAFAHADTLVRRR